MIITALTVFKYVAIILLLTGCYTQKKAIKAVDKAYINYPAPVAKFLRDKLPCDTVASKTDTVTVIESFIDSVDCPPMQTIIIDGRDTIVLPGKVVKVPVEGKKETVYITKYVTVKDRADSVYFSGIAAKVQAENNKLTKRITTIKTWRTVAWSLAAVFAAALALIIYSITKRKI